jgi:tripartite-type tricarboxylate transporter receptor subunit TctC
LLGTGAIAALPWRPLRAQTFPTRPITLYCAFPPGGSADEVLSTLAASASKILGQRVIIEHKPGARAAAAAIEVKQAPPDGYTLAQMPITVFRVQHLQKTPQLDALRDFTYIIRVAGFAFGFVVPATAPWRSLRDFIDDARRNPGKISYGTWGPAGFIPHIAIEEFALEAGIKLRHVAFGSSADVIAATIAGQVQATVDTTLCHGPEQGCGFVPPVRSGTLRLLAMFNSNRAKRWPDVPSLTELGYKTQCDVPFGIGGPAGIDPTIIKVLHDAFREALEDPRVLAILDRFDQLLLYMSPEDYTQYAQRTVLAERATIERLQLRGSM